MTASSSPSAAAPLIFAVDDMPELTELYIALLEANGYAVKAFNDRAQAVAALGTDERKPDLLITDYRGHCMPVERFLQKCSLIHPALKIVMASGFNPVKVRLSTASPIRFLRKPFTPEELQRAIRAALAV